MRDTKKRQPIIALMLSIFCTGLGQIYNGQLKKGIVFYVGSYFFGFLLLGAYSSAGTFREFENMIIITLIFFCYLLFVWGDAFVCAVKMKELNLKPYNRWYVYIIAILMSMFINEMLSLTFPETWATDKYFFISKTYKTFKIPSDTMAPTLIKGDRLVADMKCYASKSPERGEIIIFDYPKDVSKTFIKRVIGVEGDIILIKDKKIFLNDMLYNDPYGVHSDTAIISGDVKPRDNFGPVVVPKNSFFVLGDNRDRSADSRFWGFVNAEHVRGKPLYIYWSEDKRRIGISIQG